MRFLLSVFFVFFFFIGYGQDVTTLANGIVVKEDFRIQMVKQQEVKQNIEFLKSRLKGISGYRLMVLNTRDKDYAFKVRTQLLQNFPDQKPYMWFVNPYIRLKFGDFATKEEADSYKSRISALLGGATIYLLHENVNLMPGNDFNPDSIRKLVLGFN